MISRLFLNLRSVKDTTRGGDSALGGPTGAITFVSGAVGNLGEELDTFEHDTSPESFYGPSWYINDIHYS